VFQVGKLGPLDRSVENALRREMFLVRQWMTVVEVADGNNTAG
jgi:hypothetical protein